MFASGEHGDIMQNVRPVRFTEMLDFEAEEEVYDDAVAEQELPPLHAGGGGRNRHTEEKAVAADDYERRREQKLKRQVEEEVEFDDDFVKLQMERRNKRGGAGGRERQQRRRLQEQATLMAGEPYQKTIEVQSPGWYRLCVRAKLIPGQDTFPVWKTWKYIQKSINCLTKKTMQQLLQKKRLLKMKI
eukprot:scaffold571_cov175-Alexandrium_tamarense.AAC.1